MMNALLPIAPPLQTAQDPWLAHQGVQLTMLRLDQVHPVVSGNKWYKLKYNLTEAQREQHNTLLTVGGAYSNHLYATAVAGQAYGFRTIGLVRGEPHTPLNPTLQFAQDNGMQLHYVDRTAFSEITKADVPELPVFGRFYWLPEGGTNDLAVKGCAEIIPANADFDYVACCVGTGGTLAGILTSLPREKLALGFSALKGGEFLNETVNALTQAYHQQQHDNYRIITQYHFGGYARANRTLVDFINEFYGQTGIPLEPVYTGKMLYGLYDMIRQGYFPHGSRVLVVHSGGLQGVAGFNERYQKKNWQILIG